jgi:hypothetical protein
VDVNKNHHSLDLMHLSSFTAQVNLIIHRQIPRVTEISSGVAHLVDRTRTTAPVHKSLPFPLRDLCQIN